MKMLVRTLLTVWLVLISLSAWAQLEVIELRSRSAEQVLPVLLPLVEPGGTLTGVNNQLFLKASPGNRAEIKRALAALDKPLRRLIIRVAHDRQATQSARGGEANGQIVLGGSNRIQGEARVWDTRSLQRDNAAQMVQTVEGGQAFIQVGRALPLPMRQVIIGPGGAIINETTVYRDIGSGFYASPRVNGQRVTLDISQQAEQVAGNGPYGRVDRQQLSTTVSGQLGEWIELGGSGRQAQGEQGGGFAYGTRDGREQRSIWLKVEEVE